MKKARAWVAGVGVSVAALVLVAAWTAVGAAAAATAAVADSAAGSAPRTLTGQELVVSASAVEESTGRFKVVKSCRPPELSPLATWTVPFEGPVPPTAWPPPDPLPYEGRFMSRLDATLAAAAPIAAGRWSCRITGGTVTFAIESPTAHVSGTATLTPDRPASVFGDGDVYDGFSNSLHATLRYTASIVTAVGRPYIDRGVLTVDLYFAYRPSDSSFIRLSFTSDLAAPEPFDPTRSDDTSPPAVTAPYFPFASNPFASDAPTAARNKVTWSASDSVGVCAQELQRSVDGGAFAPVPVATPITRAIVLEHTFGRRYQYRVRATDCAGNTSAFKTARPFTVRVEDVDADGPLVFSSGWRALTEPSHFNSTLFSTTGTVTYTGIMRRMAVIAPRGPDSYQPSVYVDGHYAGWLATRAPAPSRRRVVWQKAWTTADQHTIKIGPSYYWEVGLDAIAILG